MMKTNAQTTSIKTYADIIGSLGQRQKFIYDYLKSQAHAVTNSEIAQALGLPINQVTPRIFELRELGLVVELRKRACSVTGRLCIAWAIKQGELF